MTATSEPRLKITYATLRNDNEQLHANYDAGLAIARVDAEHAEETLTFLRSLADEVY